MVVELTVQKRDASQKAKALRSKGSLPAVIYGRAQESTPIAIDAKTFEKVFKDAGESTVISIKGLGTALDALINEVDFDPVSGHAVHADFYAIEKGQTVTVSVPLEFEGTSPAVKDLGAVLVKVMHELEIECEPKDLPQHLVVDISKLQNIDDQILVSDLKLPPSAQVSIPMDEVVATAAAAKEEEVEEAAPVDISAIGISEERGKKEEAGEGAEAGGKAAPAEKKE